MEKFSPENKKEIQNRLQRVSGQIKGIGRMVEADTPCIEVLTQVSSVFEALRGVSKVVMRICLETCATNAICSEDKKQAEETYNNFMDVIYTFVK